MSPELQQQPEDDRLQPPLLPSDASLAWVGTRRWLFEDVNGIPWSVEERESPDGKCLFFVNDDRFVRVRRYPANWIDMPETALIELLRNPRS